jgi:hypothetical protein
MSVNCVEMRRSVVSVMMDDVRVENVSTKGKSVMTMLREENVKKMISENNEQMLTIQNSVFSSLSSTSVTGGAISLYTFPSFQFHPAPKLYIVPDLLKALLHNVTVNIFPQ